MIKTNIKLVIAYDGTEFLGWQTTRMGLSIESTLKDVLETILQEPLQLQAASRTDAGVHALGQVVNFFTKKEKLDLKKLVKSLNSLLPKTIIVLDAEAMPPSFHPTLDVKGKEYLYKINFSNFQLPQERFYAWHVPYLLDIENMQLGTTLLQGSHDYSSFCNQRNSMRYEHTIRQIDTIHISCVGETSLEILIRGNHFLYKMARNLVGTLVYVGRRKLHLDDLPTILSSKNRCYAGMTAPAHGLTLKKVIY